MSAHTAAAGGAVSIPGRLSRLRAAMAREDLAAYIVPSADPHLSEYLPERWQGRQWLSGFTGSMGTLVITREIDFSTSMAGKWPDSASSRDSTMWPSRMPRAASAIGSCGSSPSVSTV